MKQVKMIKRNFRSLLHEKTGILVKSQFIRLQFRFTKANNCGGADIGS